MKIEKWLEKFDEEFVIIDAYEREKIEQRPVSIYINFIKEMAEDIQEKEICICAAIEYDGKIWRGQRHAHCIQAQHDQLSYTMTGLEMAKKRVNRNQGFITSKNRFVDRKEGCRLQKEAGIESADKKHPYLNGELYSEDLY